MTKQIKLTPIQKTECHWMINKTCIDTLPEYQGESDTLLFRDNFKNAADNFKKQQKENRYDIKYDANYGAVLGTISGTMFGTIYGTKYLDHI